MSAEFERSDNDSVSSADIAARFDEELTRSEGSKDFEAGDARASLTQASEIIEASYRVPYLAHAPMEPMNCTVHIQNGRADVWTSTQDPLAVRGRVASVAGLNERAVTHHPSYLGGGFGRRLPFNWNVIDHATKIAMQFSVPVKTVFSREDDMQQDYYRPAVTSNFKAGLDANGNILAWHNRYTGPIQTPGQPTFPTPSTTNRSESSTEIPMCQLPHGAAWITHSRRFLPSHSLMNWPIAREPIPFSSVWNYSTSIRDISRFCRSQRKPQGMAETCPKVVPWA